MARVQRKPEAADDEEQLDLYRDAAHSGGTTCLSQKDPLLSYMEMLACCRFQNFAYCFENKYGLQGPEDHETPPRVRVLISETDPCTVLVELYSLATLNMVDPDIGNDMDAACYMIANLLGQNSRVRKRPKCLEFQGHGPHFCPGGNHHPKQTPGGSQFWHSSLTNSIEFLRLRQHGIPSVTAIHGTAIGGGVAIAMETYCRCIALTTSLCFGNLSRGAVPIFILSRHLPQALGQTAAMNIYITDATIGAAAALKGGVASFISKGISDTKARALRVVQSMGLSAFAPALLPARASSICMERMCQEGYAILRAFEKVDFGVEVKPGEGHESAFPGLRQKQREAATGGNEEANEENDEWLEDEEWYDEEEEWYDEEDEEEEEEEWWDEDDYE
mmetsp:Transcript_54317/g.129436  ORF Transcript_54317/g.129436 Transcript_54317/m.129436 type:complete len:390 (-) Transcript_54317:74-1243(-)